MSKSLEETFNFAIKLISIPYEWWNPEESMISDDGPFWSFNKGCPEIETIKSANCAGFMNLLRRFNDLEIPGVKDNNFYAGGTYVWSHYLDTFKNKFKKEINYTSGTLLLRDYRNINDQGHLAVIFDNNNILHSRSSKGICIDSKELVYDIFDFEYSIDYENWLQYK